MNAILQMVLGGIDFNAILNRILPPEKMSEAERAQAVAQLQLELMKQDWQGIEAEYADRASARSLAAQDIAKGNAFTSFLSAVVRPLWGIGAFVLVAHSIVEHVAIDAAVRDIIETVLWFYFGGRTVEKVVPHIAEAIKK